MPPLAHRGEIIQQGLGDLGRVIQPLETQVIGAAFQQSRRDRTADSHPDQGQVTVIELILQRLCARRDNRFAAAQ